MASAPASATKTASTSSAPPSSRPTPPRSTPTATASTSTAPTAPSSPGSRTFTSRRTSSSTPPAVSPATRVAKAIRSRPPSAPRSRACSQPTSTTKPTDHSSAGSYSNNSIHAGQGFGKLSYLASNLPWNPRIGGEFDYATGGHAPQPRSHRHLRPAVPLQPQRLRPGRSLRLPEHPPGAHQSRSRSRAEPLPPRPGRLSQPRGKGGRPLLQHRNRRPQSSRRRIQI